MTSRTIYALLFGLVALALLLVMVVPVYEQRIPQVLTQQVKQQINQAGHQWVTVTTEGRDLTLAGKAPTPASSQQVLAIAQDTPGIRHIDNRMTPRIITPYTLNINWNDQQLSSDGYFPTADDLQTIRHLLHKTFGENGSHQLRVGSGHPAGWNELSVTLIQALPAFEYATIDLVNQQLTMNGKIANSAQREQFLKTLQPFDQQGYTLNLHIINADALAQRCQKQFNQLLQQSIEFASGKNRISPESFTLLEDLADTALLCPDEIITIAGHTDNLGSATNNKALSLKRAQAVATWLERAGVNPSRLRTVGYGAARPVADNSTEAGRAKNRRIELNVGEP